jgi:hypothetical protein
LSRCLQQIERIWRKLPGYTKPHFYLTLEWTLTS